MATEVRETGNLIGSDKVEGTAVYGPDDQKIGSIERVMIDKKSGKVSYAVLSFGGFLGIGDHYVVVRPSAVTVSYNTSDSKWHATMNASADQLKAAPEYKYPSKT